MKWSRTFRLYMSVARPTGSGNGCGGRARPRVAREPRHHVGQLLEARSRRVISASSADRASSSSASRILRAWVQRGARSGGMRPTWLLLSVRRREWKASPSGSGTERLPYQLTSTTVPRRPRRRARRESVGLPLAWMTRSASAPRGGSCCERRAEPARDRLTCRVDVDDRDAGARHLRCTATRPAGPPRPRRSPRSDPRGGSARPRRR